MKILLVYINRHVRWADTFRAEVLKREWVNDEVEMADSRHLPDGDKYDVIHFLYSGGMTKRKDYILKYKDKVFTSLASQRTLDCLFDDMPSLIKIYKNTRMCVCQNKGLMEKLKSMIQQTNVCYIPNGVDTELFNRKFVVGFVSTKDSVGHKGLPLIQQACQELGLELKIMHERYLPHERMPEFYREIDCLVLASLSEGCSNPTLEALAMNKPVLSTRVGIADELDGVTIIDRNVESIKAALNKLSGRRMILENFTWKKIAAQYRSLYG